MVIEKEVLQETKINSKLISLKDIYSKIWDKTDIHVGIYDKPNTRVKKAAENTVLRMLRMLPGIKKNTKILNLGSGYGDTARFLAEKYGCQVDCFNSSEVENQYNLEQIEEAGLEKKVNVFKGNYKKLPFARENYDIVWSQDLSMHSHIKEGLFREVATVLKPEGRFVFTAHLQNDECPPNLASEIQHFNYLGTPKRYKQLARKADLEQVLVKQMSDHFIKHYEVILEMLGKKENTLRKKVGKLSFNRIQDSLQDLIDSGKNGYYKWGILQFQKRNI